MKGAMKRQRGQVLPLALMLLGAGALIIGPLLGYMSTAQTGLRTTSAALEVDYAVDAGVEHAMWRLNYDSSFASSLAQEVPSIYSITVNGRPVQIAVTKKNLLAEGGGGEPPPQSDRITVAKTVEPATAPLGVETVFTFTIQIENVGTSRVHLEATGDDLPAGFVYVPGSSTGITASEPSIVVNDVEWQFSTPLPFVEPGELRTQTFQARATLEEGVYYDVGWVAASPESIGTISTGPTAPISPSGERYNVEVSTHPSTARAAIRIQGGTVTVLSWEIQ